MTEHINTRDLALDVLLMVARDGEFSHIALKSVLDKYRYLPRRDRAFIARLSMGTIERAIELDYIIDQFSKVKVNKMKPVIRAILRSGVYQLKYMDAVPASAACNEAVKLAAKRGFSGLKGFVNGVMRAAAKGLGGVAYPDPDGEPARALSVRYSMPEWLAARFLEQFGRERCERILGAYLREKPLSVRVDTGRASVEEVMESMQKQGITAKRDSRLPYALSLSGYETLEEIPEFADGLLYAQDISSMMAAEAAQPKEGDFVLDVCAAPGGKSIQIAQKLRGTGMVEARDISARKTELIEENAARCRLSNLRVKAWDAREFDREMEDAADIVIADLPCSGLGVIGTKPDIKYNVTGEKIGELAALQREILAVVRRYVKPGGTLVYSTCTVTPEENERQAEWFARAFPEFHMEQQVQLLPDEDCDGFFIARFRRISDTRRT